MFFLTFRLPPGADTISTMNNAPETFAEFWNFYVLAHRQLATRIFQTIGTLGGWSLLGCHYFAKAPVFAGRGRASLTHFAWFSHFFVWSTTAW